MLKTKKQAAANQKGITSLGDGNEFDEDVINNHVKRKSKISDLGKGRKLSRREQ